MNIHIKKEFPKDHITREAGEKLRNAIVENSKKKVVTNIDFEGVQIASTSFFDEAFAKLTLEGWTTKDFELRVKIRNMDPHDHEVFIRVCQYRGIFI